jgi:formate-dependent nitrite reductase membrane component NrfD
MLDVRLNPVHWDWLVWLEMFVAGVAAGAFVAGMFLELAGRGRSAAARTAHLIPFPLMALATLLLVFDLTRPERFWHMVVMSERMLPILKPWSPISMGTWLVMLFTLVSFISFLDALIGRGMFSLGGWRHDRTLYGAGLGRFWAVLGTILALAVGIYSGVLLTVSNFPGWGSSPLLPAVYVATALITGIAAVVLIEALQGHIDPDVLGLAGANTWLIVWWLITVVVFLITLIGGGAGAFFTGLPLIAILAGIVLAGVIPLILHALRPMGLSGSLAVSAALVLVGGLLLRYGLAVGPQIH